MKVSPLQAPGRSWNRRWASLAWGSNQRRRQRKPRSRVTTLIGSRPTHQAVECDQPAIERWVNGFSCIRVGLVG